MGDLLNLCPLGRKKTFCFLIPPSPYSPPVRFGSPARYIASCVISFASSIVRPSSLYGWGTCAVGGFPRLERGGKDTRVPAQNGRRCPAFFLFHVYSRPVSR